MFTSDPRITSNEDYKKIADIVQKMTISGAIWLGRGQCISMSEMMRMSLAGVGIKSRLVECQLTLTNDMVSPPAISHIGFDGVINPGEIDTHVVVITDTTPPMLIDSSIAHRLPEHMHVVVDTAYPGDDGVICKSGKSGISLVYQQKRSQKLTWDVQNSIIERISTDKKIFNTLNSLKILIAIALLVSTINFARGFYDFYHVHILGETSDVDIQNRLDQLERLIKLPQEERSKN